MNSKFDKERYIERQSKSVRELIYEFLREGIIEGSYKSGTKLNERKLADEFKVSTTPVKEALRLLEKEGLVKTISRKGSFVSDNVMTSIEEIAWLRVALEGIAARLSAKKRTDEDIENMTNIINKINQYTEEKNAKKLKEYNTLFHDSILKSSQNDYIKNQIKSIRSYDLYIRGEVLSNSTEHQNALKEHSSIYIAIKEQDENAAEELMRNHIIRSAELVVKK